MDYIFALLNSSADSLDPNKHALQLVWEHRSCLANFMSVLLSMPRSAKKRSSTLACTPAAGSTLWHILLLRRRTLQG